jgi:transposase-like protein
MAQQPRKQPKSPMKKFTLADMQRKYPDDKACLEWLFNHQYPDGITCEKCGVIKAKYHYIAGRKGFSCQWCGHYVFPAAGTIFDHSPTPLTIWFYVIYQLSQTRTGISAKQIQRETGVTYKTAWRMCTEIRKRLSEGGDAFGSGGGNVEVDETYVGGVRKGKRGRGAAGKTAVVGAVERKGRVKAQVVPNTEAQTVLPFVDQTVDASATVHTDEYPVYSKLGKRGYDHVRISHSSGEFVAGNIHTNSIEGFWAQIKNAVHGVHHGVAPEYLQLYVNEYAFRYSHRNDTTPMFQTILERVGMSIE